MQNITRFASINPVSNSLIQAYDFITNGMLDHKIAKAHEGYKVQRKRTFQERAKLANRMGDLLEKNATDIAKTMAMEMGKPLVAGKGEVLKTAGHFRYYAKNAEKMLAPKPIICDAKEAQVVYQPTGPLLTVMPWNFPIWLPFKCGLPNLMLGNSLILKPSPTTPRCGLILEELMNEAGYNSGEFQTVFADVPQIETMLADPRVTGVSLTGSTRAGKSIGALAGKYVKRCVLELGGSDPFIVTAEADLKLAAKLGATARVSNTGQVCIAAKRFLVDEKIHDAYMEELMKELRTNYHVGDPMDLKVNVGPMARPDLLKSLKEQLAKTLELGANLIYGDKEEIYKELKENEGNFISPMIFTDVPKNSPAYMEEIFGPAFMVFKYRTEAEAVAMANETEYGLGGSIICRDIAKAKKLAMQVESGSVFINEFTKTDSRVPFGGTKCSGHGRECGDEGLKEFSNPKTIYVGK